MAGAVLTCAVALVDGVCPAGSEVWLEQAVLSPGDVDPLLYSCVLGMVVAVGVRWLIRVIRGGGGGA